MKLVYREIIEKKWQMMRILNDKEVSDSAGHFIRIGVNDRVDSQVWTQLTEGLNDCGLLW